MKAMPKVISPILLLLIILSVSGCDKLSLRSFYSDITNYKNVPGVTQDEIKAIDELRKKDVPLTYAAPFDTETFINENGEICGFTVLFCEWLSGFFDLTFHVEIHDPDGIPERLESGDIDFVGLISASEHSSDYLMTEPIVGRSLKILRLRENQPHAAIAASRPVRYVLMEEGEDSVSIQFITGTFTPGSYEIEFAKDHAEVYQFLKNGQADAFITVNTVESAFDHYGDIIAEDYLPLTLLPVSMAARDPALSSIISVVNKALENGGTRHLAGLYKQGYKEYLKHKLFMGLSDEEKAYIQDNPVIPFATQYYAYPTSFYNTREAKWDGIIFDLIAELKQLTGLSFELVHDNTTELPETVRLLNNGTAYMIPNLIPTDERRKMFLLSENIYMSDRFALLSKRDYPNIELNDITHERIGLVSGSAFTEVFHKWFPDTNNVKEYPNTDDAFIGLERGEVDLVLSSQSRLSSMNNYYGFSGYKANYLFDDYFDFSFMYNKDHALLCSILDKAFPMVNTERIVEQWLTKSYNYEELLLREQRPWLYGAIGLSLCVIVLVTMLLTRSRNAEERLKELVAAQTSTITAIFDAAPDFIFCKDLNSLYTKCNKSMEEYFGIREEDIIGKSDGAAFGLPDSVAEQFMAEDRRVIEEKQVLYFEEQVTSIDGKSITFETFKAPVFEKGKVAGVMGISRDITERKAAMESLHRSAAEKDAITALQSIFSGLNVMIYVTDPETYKILFINDYMKQHYNIKDNCVDQLCYKTLREGMNERCSFCPCIRLDSEPDAVIEWEEHNSRTKRFYRNTGRYIHWVDGRTVYLHHAVDITDMKYELMKYELTRGAMGIALWDMEIVPKDPTREYNPFIWSQEFRNMLGFSDEHDFPNMLHSWSDRLHPEDKERALGAFAAHINDYTGKTPYDIEYRLMRKDGEYRHFRAFGATLRGEAGEPLRVAGAIEDIHEKKRIEQEINDVNLKLREALKQANAASRAKSDFLSHMSHEMRTPMNAIIGMTMIGKNADSADKKNYALNKIEGASSHLLGIINDVLDMAKIEANKLELSSVEFDFDRMLQAVVSVINFRVEEKQQQLFLDIDKDIPRFLVGDDQRLSQVIMNLLSNAVKFTPEKGEIRLNASLVAEDEGICELRIEVSDTGIGIPPEQQARLFQAFEQAERGISREYGGTGLGLVISKNIVELMNGRIWIESQIGKGSRFIFTIKVQRGKQDQSPLPAPVPEDSNGKITVTEGMFKNKKMLLVEDIEINREIMIALLEDTGINIDCAENGREAVEKIKAEPDKYDIVFMDLQMPKMDGFEATRQIRSLPERPRGRLPIIAMTANVFKSDIDECIKAGMDDHLGKPLAIDTVLEKLRNYLPPI